MHEHERRSSTLFDAFNHWPISRIRNFGTEGMALALLLKAFFADPTNEIHNLGPRRGWNQGLTIASRTIDLLGDPVLRYHSGNLGPARIFNGVGWVQAPLHDLR